MTKARRLFTSLALASLSTLTVMADDIAGTVTDATDHSPLVGASVQAEGTQNIVVTDIDGHFRLTGLKAGKYRLIVKYISYKPLTVAATHTVATGEDQDVTIALSPDEKTLGEVAVTGVARHNTDVAMVEMARNSSLVVSNVSAQDIRRTQDTNASEVIRRVPGVSIIDGQFVMVRGLSQRYNNVWINGGAAPSSEADSRAFSFDLIPSSQIDNMQIVKTPSPEYPADYSGGFIVINTKDIPSENTADIQVGANWNTTTSFSRFLHSSGSSTDFLGFDSGKRSLSGGIGGNLKALGDGVDLQGNGFNNDWRLRTSHPWGDLKLAASIGRRWRWNGCQWGLTGALNYTNEYRTYTGMDNNLFGVYDAAKDRSNYLHQYSDNQYNHNARLGALFNITMLSRSGNNKYQFKNIFNQLGNDRYTWREGINAQSDNEQSAEYYYRSRTTYNTQLLGRHTLTNDVIEWSGSYSYANRNVPDRRRYQLYDGVDKGVMLLNTQGDTSREWTRLDEHIASVSASDTHIFTFGQWQPTLRSGLYGEYRTRTYRTRTFNMQWNDNANTLPSDFRSRDVTEMFSDESYFGADKFYLLEQTDMRDNYKGHNTLGAAYVAATLPFGRWNIYAGLRYEYDRMEMIVNTRSDKESPLTHTYTYNDLFPSVNATYKLNTKHQLRLSYGRTVNRPEFREMSPSVFYDFDLASDVQGNTSLKPCYVQNIDLRYEFYPSRGESVSLAAFYKYFDSPIEWTYTVTGGTDLVYSYINARSANTYGLELDIRKDLSFIGLKGFSWSFNGALIKSRVRFDASSRDENRPMQGQSPYLVNTGIFYKNERAALDIALLYNRIGKRIVGVGRTSGSTGGQETLRVPDSYEMPRDMIDLSVSKRFGSHWEIRANVRDLLAQRIYYKQFAEVDYDNGSHRRVEQVTRSYRPGRNIGLQVRYSF